LAGVVEAVLGDEGLNEMPVGLQDDPAADLQGDGKRLAQPLLALLGPTFLEREDAEAADDVLHLEIAVTSPLEPGPGLEAEALGLVGTSAVVGHDPEPGGGLRLDPVASELLGEFEAA